MTQPNPNPAAGKPRLNIVHGEKGGVGKTTVARVIAEYLAARDAHFRAFDAEGPTGPMLRFHPDETQPVDIATAVSVAPVLDYLMDGQGGRKLALVDLGARTGADLKSWLYRGGALEEAESGRLGLTLIYVVGGAVDSVGHLKECYEALGKGPSYVIVRNTGVAREFEVYDQSNIRQEMLQNGAREIMLPELDQHVYQNIDRNSLQFGAFAESQNTGFSYTERRYARTWLRECFAAIEEVAALIR